jgi:hypothetical protein
MRQEGFSRAKRGQMFPTSSKEKNKGFCIVNKKRRLLGKNNLLRLLKRLFLLLTC